MQEIHFITGKGGVGKSFVAAALAESFARKGQKTLLVELGHLSYYSYFFNFPISYTPRTLEKNWDIALWNGSDCLKEYARYLLKIETLFKLFFENPVSRSLINIAPALQELAILGKITSGPRHHGPPPTHEVLIVDAFSTGHFLNLLRAPKGMAQAVKLGPMGEQSRSIDEYLFRKNLCHFHIVTLPEELPTQEAIELAQTLKEEFSIEPKIILNKVWKTFLTSSQLEPALQANSDSRFLHFLTSQLQHLEISYEKLKSKSFPLSTLGWIHQDSALDMVKAASMELRP